MSRLGQLATGCYAIYRQGLWAYGVKVQRVPQLLDGLFGWFGDFPPIHDDLRKIIWRSNHSWKIETMRTWGYPHWLRKSPNDDSMLLKWWFCILRSSWYPNGDVTGFSHICVVFWHLKTTRDNGIMFPNLASYGTTFWRRKGIKLLGNIICIYIYVFLSLLILLKPFIYLASQTPGI